jgi:stress-induced morphogen
MFQAFIISDEFQGVKLLERQKAVNACLADEIAQIHALELKCWT